MPLNASSPVRLHILQNAALIALSMFCAPLVTLIALLSHVASPYTAVSKHINNHRKWRVSSSATFRPRTVLVTGVGMSKGLAIARSFYRGGHCVIGADFEPHAVPVNGRFSAALAKFYRLTKPSPEAGGSADYIESLINIIMKENVELWVSCSGVASAVEDGEAAEAVEKVTRCRAIQFGVSMTETLHEKHSFVENTRKLGLNVPKTRLVTSVEDAMGLLDPENHNFRKAEAGKQFIMKPVGVDDSVRSDMTLLPLASTTATQKFIERMRPSSSRPFVLQQFLSGPEYCTHAIIIRGRVKAFTACPSADLLMHYRALPPTSSLSRAMLQYTEVYAAKMGSEMTGHFSLDFLLDEPEIQTGKKSVDELMTAIYPIECNPRAHTAVVLFGDLSEDMAEAYLSILPDHESKGIASGHRREEILIPSSTVPGYYWVGHDIVTRLLLPFWGFITLKVGLMDLLSFWAEFLERLIFWKDGTYEVWDPWPFWWLYIGYWPGMFLLSIVNQKWWSRCNVSTTKMFGV